ncbi:MAG: FHA domain-containing protein [Paludibacteraceae bacterium]
MANATQAYKKSFAGSVGAGMGSLIGGGKKTYYVLEHKVSSKYHRAGESQEIIVDQIELGRDSHCAVQFDESFKTVSRRHAAIVRDGDRWKLVQLSQTNTTFLNGHPVQSEWYLQNGDEIQLSVNGPKLGFIIPQNNQVGTIGLSRRLSAFRQQALKPYKTAMWSMAACILLLIVTGFGVGLWQHKQITYLVEKGELTQKQIEQAEIQHQEALAAAKADREALEKQLKNVKADMKKLKENTVGDVKEPKTVTSSNTSNATIAKCESDVYYVFVRKIIVSIDGQTGTLENVCSGTGFLLSDGRFVTARHVVEPWAFLAHTEDESLIACNQIANNGGKVVSYLDAYSPSGKQLHFVSTNAIINRQTDEVGVTQDGVWLSVAHADATDYAYFRTNEKGGLKYDATLSQKLPVQTKLTVLGYPLRIGGTQSPDGVHAIYSEAIVAREGLEDGRILTTATTYEQGNSGGPVFATTKDGEMIVVGIVSAGAGRSTGFVVPISVIE